MSDKQFYVTVTCTVEKIVTCENCTEEQARSDPWEYAIDEQETMTIDWQVISVKEDDGK